MRSFKLHKGILTCILSLFSSFFSFPPFSLPFSSPPSNSSLFFNWDKNTFPPQGGGWPEYISLQSTEPGIEDGAVEADHDIAVRTVASQLEEPAGQPSVLGAERINHHVRILCYIKAFK